LLSAFTLFAGCSSKTIKPEPIIEGVLSEEERNVLENEQRVEFIKQSLADTVSTCVIKGSLNEIVGFNKTGVNKFFTIKATSCTVNYNEGVPYVIESKFIYLEGDVFFQEKPVVREDTINEKYGYYLAGGNGLIYITRELHSLGENYLDISNKKILNFDSGRISVVQKNLKSMIFKNNVLVTKNGIRFRNKRGGSSYFKVKTNLLVSTLKYSIIQGESELYIIHNNGEFKIMNLSSSNELNFLLQGNNRYYLLYINGYEEVSLSENMVKGYALKIEDGYELVPSNMSHYKGYENIFKENGIYYIANYKDIKKPYGSLIPIENMEKDIVCNGMKPKRCFLPPY
jgi:hypothetical protein